ncbi:peptidylprolyl isomerase [Nocardioides jishulii]|uniref:Peptidylprolyl isomerase n=1 Tax=Nocardioides jishulii TaxID=2575440 RepID=A0A4U2YN32_9ACTN|nr:peptidylprolyl isomerase [Nocardioides jishulii]QCX27583.1 peptidylprolyl isomerase [Nocardioides jishulii]TKI62390.1 peptidylprolyl isomerase [Nocardioides jishulii]
MNPLHRAARVAVLTFLAGSVLVGCGADNEKATAIGSKNCDYPSASQSPAVEVEVPPATPDLPDTLTATLVLGQGPVTIELTPERTPCTVNNFVTLAEQGYFDGTECHRLTTAGIYVLQCGDPTASGTGGPGWTIPDEVDGSESYPAGTVAMAKTQAPDSGGSQFFLVYDETPLPPEYTVFGEMDKDSIATVAAIAAKGSEPADDGAPRQRTVITSVEVE